MEFTRTNKTKNCFALFFHHRQSWWETLLTS